MTPEQERALALARARQRRAQAVPQEPQVQGQSVIATTKDGGQVMRGGDGAMSYVSPGYSTNDPARIEQILQGATPAEAMRESIDEELIAQNPVAARAAKFVQGVPFVGEYADEAVGLVDPRAAANMRATQDAMGRQRPGQSMAAGLAGGILGSIPLVASGAGAVAKLSGPLQRTAAAVGIGAVGAGVEGAISGYGAGTDPEDRKRNAQVRGATGAVLGGAVAGAAPAVAMGARAGMERIKRLDIRVIADEFGIGIPAARMVKRYLANDDLAAASAALARAGDGSMLGDAGPGTGQLLDTAMARGGEALRIGREATESRASAQGARLTETLDDILGTPDGLRGASRSIAQRTSQARQAAYKAAYARPIDYASDSGRAVEGVLSRIPSRTLRQAITEANEAMQAEGIRNMQVLAEIAEDGAVSFREMPNVQQLDAIKRALGDIAERETDAVTGKITGAGLRASKLAGDLRDATAAAVPAYSRALKLGGDKIAEDNALRMGRDLLTRRVTLEDVREIARGQSKEANQAARRGLREGIETTISNVRRTISDPNTDAREAMAMVKDMSSRANMAKLRLILGKDADRLMKDLDETAAALNLRATVARGSQTAFRQIGNDALEEATQPGAVGQLLEASPMQAARSVVRSLTGATPEAAAGRKDQIAAEIARALTQKRGPEAQAALEAVRKAMEGQPLKDAEIDRIIRQVGVPMLSTLYQAAGQSQRTTQ